MNQEGGGGKNMNFTFNIHPSLLILCLGHMIFLRRSNLRSQLNSKSGLLDFNLRLDFSSD